MPKVLPRLRVGRELAFKQGTTTQVPKEEVDRSHFKGDGVRLQAFTRWSLQNPPTFSIHCCPSYFFNAICGRSSPFVAPCISRTLSFASQFFGTLDRDSSPFTRIECHFLFQNVQRSTPHHNDERLTFGPLVLTTLPISVRVEGYKYSIREGGALGRCLGHGIIGVDKRIQQVLLLA